MPKDAQLIFRVEVEVKDALQERADKEGVTVSVLARRLLTLLTEVPMKTLRSLLASSQAISEQSASITKQIEEQNAAIAEKLELAKKGAQLVVDAEVAYEKLKARWTHLKSQTVAIEAGIAQAEETLKFTGRRVAIKLADKDGSLPEVEVLDAEA